MPIHQPINARPCFISTFPPRECGIATFTHDLFQAVCQSNEALQPNAVSITNTSAHYDYPPEVVFEIQQPELKDYRLAAEYINLSGAGVVSLQHEFGIFGGAYGRY